MRCVDCIICQHIPNSVECLCSARGETIHEKLSSPWKAWKGEMFVMDFPKKKSMPPGMPQARDIIPHQFIK